MKNALVTLLLLFTSCVALADSPIIVELPGQYTADDVQGILRSIDYSQLAQEADKTVPGFIAK